MNSFGGKHSQMCHRKGYKRNISSVLESNGHCYDEHEFVLHAFFVVVVVKALHFAFVLTQHHLRFELD